jgi:hypothetical protein
VSAFALKRLNETSAAFALDPLWQPKVAPIVSALVGGQSSYTLGSGGNVSTPRCEALTAVAIDVAGVYTVLTQVGSEDWDNTTKSSVQGGVPTAFRYIATDPLGRLDIFPIPSENYTLYVTPQAQGLQYDFNDPSGLPVAYEGALVYVLAATVGEAMGRDMGAVRAKAETMVARIKRNADKPRTLENELSWIGC